MPQAEQKNITSALPFPALMTEREVAANTGISISLLRQMRRRGDGPAFVKVGALVRYPATAFAAWIDSLPLCEQRA